MVEKSLIPPIKILQITPHLGGGVGSVLTDYILHSSATTDLTHTLLVLDLPLTAPSTKLLSALRGYFLYRSIDNHQLSSLFDDHDFICVHYWNHPLIVSLLLADILPRSKLLLWCHTLGRSIPALNSAICLNRSSHVIYTSPLSLQLLDQEHVSSPSSCVVSTRDMSSFYQAGLSAIELSSPRKRLLYLGTVSYAKLHPQAGSLFVTLAKLGYEVTVVGGPDHETLLTDLPWESARLINVVGPTSNPLHYYQHADIFVYPLTPTHFGTGEQVLGEAMSYGLPVVVFDNPTELFLLGHSLKLSVAHDLNSFVQVVNQLSNNDLFYQKLSHAARTRARNLYSLPRQTSQLRDVLNRFQPLNNQPPDPLVSRLRSFYDHPVTSLIVGSLGIEEISNLLLQLSSFSCDPISQLSATFLKALGSGDSILQPRKGYPLQYLHYFPESTQLQKLCRRLCDLST